MDHTRVASVSPRSGDVELSILSNEMRWLALSRLGLRELRPSDDVKRRSVVEMQQAETPAMCRLSQPAPRDPDHPMHPSHP